MATIDLIHKRVGNDIQMAVQILDNETAISWSEVSDLEARLFSDSQRVRLGLCTIDGALPQDETTMMLTYSGKNPQYLGVARLILSFKYRGHICSLDTPVLYFVPSTSEEGIGPVEVYIPANVDPEINSLQIVVGGGGSASWGTITGRISNQTDLQDALDSKEDTIPDLEEIRRGAGAGATAYQKPNSGIPSSDMTSEVQASLLKADLALQEETDPTVPAWAKAANKPSYSYSEINGTPDLSAFITKTVNDLVYYYTKSETYTQAEVNALIGAIQQFHYEIYARRQDVVNPQTNVLYLIGPTGSGVDKYEEYVYTNNTWTKIGDTSIDLSGYVTIEALNTALEGYTTTADLTTLLAEKQDVISDLANIRNGAAEAMEAVSRDYDSQSPNGLGYKVLSKDADFADQVTEANTIYEIRNDFDLDSGSVTIPAGCILKFNGGSISNGTITGTQTAIEAGDYAIFGNIVFAGSFKGALNAVWVGAKQNDSSFDNSAIIQAWFDTYAPTFRDLFFPEATYYFRSTATLTTDKRNLTLNGGNSRFNVNIATDDSYFLVLQTPSGSSGEQFRLENVLVYNVKQTSGLNISRTRGILFDRAQRFEVNNVQMWYFDIAFYLVDIWDGAFGGSMVLRYNRVGVLITGKVSDESNCLQMSSVDFVGVTREVASAIYPQAPGEDEDDYLMRTASCGIDSYVHLQGVDFLGCCFQRFDYGVRLNFKKKSSTAASDGGPLLIDNCYFEANRTYDIYSGEGNYLSMGEGSNIHQFTRGITISNCRFFTIKKVFVNAVWAFISNNQNFTIDTGALSTTVDYEGDMGIGSIGTLTTLHKIGPRAISEMNASGAISSPYYGYQKMQQARYYGQLTSRQNAYTKTSSSGSTYPVQYRASDFASDPSARVVLDIIPWEYINNQDNSYNRLLVPSGNALSPVRVYDDYNFRALNTFGDITLFEFMRRWKAGTSYTGTVKNLFPFRITADPVTGTVRNESGTLVGFGINALGSTVTTSTTTNYYLFIDALIWVRISYARIKQAADHLQCGRSYGELRGSIDDYSSYSAYLSMYGNDRDSVQKRINAIYYQTSDSKLYIYDGFSWVEMTTPFQRYYYKAYGLKLSERATMADLPGQTFTNHATGITYTFDFRANNNYQWVAGVGKVDSLDHPNGYNADNTLDYANELSAGEQVVYNGALYTWNGTGFVANTLSLTAGGSKIWAGTQAEYDLLTPSSDTLYFIKSS